MKTKINKRGFFNLPIMAIGEVDTYCPVCYEVLIFNKPTTAGMIELTCPVCGNTVLYKKGNTECQK